MSCSLAYVSSGYSFPGQIEMQCPAQAQSHFLALVVPLVAPGQFVLVRDG